MKWIQAIYMDWWQRSASVAFTGLSTRVTIHGSDDYQDSLAVGVFRMGRISSLGPASPDMY